MFAAPLVVAAVLAVSMMTARPQPFVDISQGSIEGGLPRTPQALVDFGERIRTYVQIHRAAAEAAPPLRVTTASGEIRQAIDALALGIRLRRIGAKQGDIFTPAVAALIRDAVREGCHGQYAELLALVNEELESPLPGPVIHTRWPEGVPLPTMPPDLLAALPRLPPELEYRFINRDLVLIDIDANLIVDFVPDAIPEITSSW
jgi:hypothetical protein